MLVNEFEAYLWRLRCSYGITHGGMKALYVETNDDRLSAQLVICVVRLSVEHSAVSVDIVSPSKHARHGKVYAHAETFYPPVVLEILQQHAPEVASIYGTLGFDIPPETTEQHRRALGDPDDPYVWVAGV